MHIMFSCRLFVVRRMKQTTTGNTSSTAPRAQATGRMAFDVLPCKCGAFCFVAWLSCNRVRQRQADIVRKGPKERFQAGSKQVKSQASSQVQSTLQPKQPERVYRLHCRFPSLEQWQLAEDASGGAKAIRVCELANLKGYQFRKLNSSSQETKHPE